MRCAPNAVAERMAHAMREKQISEEIHIIVPSILIMYLFLLCLTRVDLKNVPGVVNMRVRLGPTNAL